jgi:hypothetical protein
MLLGLALPDFGPDARCTLIAWHAAPGDALVAGAPLVDLRVDLSGGLAQDCPPVTTCRILLGEAAWLRQTFAAAGDTAPDRLALLSTEPDLPADGEPARAVRSTAAAILHHDDWWGAT